MDHHQIVNAKIAKYAKMCQVEEYLKEGKGRCLGRGIRETG
jgi:hypothetical protein